MADWVYWFAVAGVLVAVEIFTGTFYLLMLAFGMVAGGIVALTGLGVAFQFAVAGIIGAAVTLLLNKSRFGARNRRPHTHDPNVNMDIGKTLAVGEWHAVSGGSSQSRVSYRGTMWDVELEKGSNASPGMFVIREVRANRLIVENVAE